MATFSRWQLFPGGNFFLVATSSGFQLLLDGNFYRVVTSTEVGTFTGVGTSTGQQFLAFTLMGRIEVQIRFKVKYFTSISIHTLRVYDLLTNS